MKRKQLHIIMVMLLTLCLLCTACGGNAGNSGSIENIGSAGESISPQDDPNEGLGGNEFYSWNSELYQRNVSEFEGIWYYDGDLAAETYIVIDDTGNWSYYQRAPGAEAAEMDCGIFSYSTNEASVYYADSSMYDGVSYRVFEFDNDVLIWGDEGAYYLME